MNRINVFVRRQRIKKFEAWTIRAIAAEAFLLALNPFLASAVAVFGIVVWFLRLQIDKKFKMRSLPFDVPITIFIILGAISVFMSPVRSFELIYNYCGIVGIFLLTYLLVGQNIRGVKDLKILAKSLAAAAVIVVALGFFQYFFGVDASEMKVTDIDHFSGYTKIFATFENPSVLAEYLDIMICLALGLLAKFGTTKQKLILLAAVVILTLCLSMTYSRGAFLAIAAIFVIYGLLYDWRILIFFALGTTFLLYNNTVLLERVLSVFTTNDLSNELRFVIWVGTISMVADHPFVGIGWGAYEFVYPQYNYYFLEMKETIFHAHNLYLQKAAEVGIAGALAFFWYFFGTMFLALNFNANERCEKIKHTAGNIARRAKESTFKKKFDAELVKTFAESKFLQNLAQIKSMMILRLSDSINQFFDKTDKEETKTKSKKKSEPELVHHEELTLNGKNKKSKDDKKSDDDNIDIQKFAEIIEFVDNKQKIAERQFVEGIRLGIGLAFLSIALIGFSVDSLFNVSISILMWMLGAAAAALSLFDEEN